ncbi:MAG: large repetitive protein, partial [Acidimicrobiaceae bacterium]|nr:large repetitive protein [Acidimicrobiaceae bacterium]
MYDAVWGWVPFASVALVAEGRRVNWGTGWTVALVAAGAMTVLLTAAEASGAATAQWLRQSPPSSPSARSQSASAWDPAGHRVLVFGGIDNTGSNHVAGDTWSWDGTTWAQQAGAGPSTRYATVMTTDEARRQVVLFGGSKSYQVSSGEQQDLPTLGCGM